MPVRTNEFQNMIALLTVLMREDESRKVTSSAMVNDKATGLAREVDIVVEAEVAGHKVVVGIECRAWARAQTVEWVEAMYGKHAHLETDALVLVSSSGFTKAALGLAEYLKIEALKPGQVTPDFVGEVVNNLGMLWAKVVDLKPERMELWVQWPEGDVQVVHASGEMGIYLPDGTLVCDVKELLRVMMSQFNMNTEYFRDATGEEQDQWFEFGHEHPMLGDQPLCLLPYIEGSPTTPVQIIKAVIFGPMNLQVAETPLKHGSYKGVNYSAGRAQFGDRAVDLAAIEAGRSGLTWAIVQSPAQNG
jgi:hypothetical protein